MTRAKAENETAAGATSEPGAGLALAEEKIGARIAEREGLGFDPAMIIMIIQAVITAISGCGKTTPARLRRKTNANRASLGTAIRQHTGCDFRLALARAELVLDAANDASDDELNLLIRDCCT